MRVRSRCSVRVRLPRQVRVGSQVRPRSHHKAPFLMVQSASTPARSKAAIRPRVGWWPTTRMPLCRPPPRWGQPLAANSSVAVAPGCSWRTTSVSKRRVGGWAFLLSHVAGRCPLDHLPGIFLPPPRLESKVGQGEQCRVFVHQPVVERPPVLRMVSQEPSGSAQVVELAKQVL